MTTCNFTVDPFATETQTIKLPVDSFVYIGMKSNAISGWFMPSFFLNQNHSTEYNQSWLNYWVRFNSTGTQTLDTNYPLNANGLALARFTTGYVPFDDTFTAEVYGCTRSFGGEAKSVTRKTYQKPDGSTFLLDSYTITRGNLLLPLWNQTEGLYSGQLLVTCYMVRDSEGTMLGGFSTGWGRTIYKKVGNRTKAIWVPTLQPETIYGNLPFTPYYDSDSGWNGSEISFVPATEATKVGSNETVSITDYFYYTVAANPVTFPMRITADERSYSYIQL